MARRGNIYSKAKKEHEGTNVILEKIENNKTENEDANSLEVDSAQVLTLETPENINVQKKVEDIADKEKKRQTKQIVFLVIFVLVLVGITTIKLVSKYNEINSAVNNKNNVSNVEDSKYGITDYKEMYYKNPINIKHEQYYVEKNKGNNRTEINYVTISGLKDKEFQAKINKEIKDAAYKYYDYIGGNEDYLVYTNIAANFSNILSIQIELLMWNDDEENYRIDEQVVFNYNLITGETISFYDVFASNTPMNYIIYNMAYTALAWDTEINFDASESEWDKNTNMDNRDTSEYEDIILKNIRDFEKIKKENIEFYITPARIYVKMRLGNNENYTFVGIPAYKYAEYITIYKKFLVSDDILKETYESMPNKKFLVFSENLVINKYYEDHVYDNLYLSVNLLGGAEFDEEYYADYSEAIKVLRDQKIETNTVAMLNKYKELAENDKKHGYIVRVMMDTYLETFENDYGKEDYVVLYIESVVDKADIDYYNTHAFKSLAARIESPKVDVYGAVLGELNDNNITRMEKESISNTYFYDINGKIIAKNYDDLEIYMENKYKESIGEERKLNIYSEGEEL